MEYIVLTQHMFHFAALLKYMAVKYTVIYFTSIYFIKAAMYYTTSISTTKKLYHNSLGFKDSCDCLIITIDCRNV